MTISKDLLLAILSLDSYNRGYGAGIVGLGGAGSKIGSATINDVDLPTGSLAAGFYAVSYNTSYGTVISYRGTDNFGLTTSELQGGSDVFKGWTTGTGYIGGSGQAPLALEFYKAATGKEYYEKANNTILTGHSLGGGLAGFNSHLYNIDAVMFDNEPYRDAAASMAANDNERCGRLAA